MTDRDMEHEKRDPHLSEGTWDCPVCSEPIRFYVESDGRGSVEDGTLTMAVTMHAERLMEHVNRHLEETA